MIFLRNGCEKSAKVLEAFFLFFWNLLELPVVYYVIIFDGGKWRPEIVFMVSRVHLRNLIKISASGIDCFNLMTTWDLQFTHPMHHSFGCVFYESVWKFAAETSKNNL